MTIEGKKKFIINFIYFVIISFIIYFVMNHLVGYIMPFLVGFIFVFIMKPVARRIEKYTKLSYKISSLISLLILYIFFIVLIILGGRGIFLGVRGILVDLPDLYNSYLLPTIIQVSETIEGWLMNVNPSVIDELSNYTNTLITQLGSLATKISSSAVKGVSGVPSFLLSSLITIISSFFIAGDYYGITRFIVRQFPKKAQHIIIDTKDYIVTVGFNFLKAYAILMSVTFVELSIGLSILNISNPVVLALLISVFDILPFLGTGGIILPWAFIEFLNGNIQLAIGFIVMYLIITVVRQTLESRIVGHQIGLHPIVTLISMYVGIKIFGGVGIFILPIIIITLKHLNDEGRINIFK